MAWRGQCPRATLLKTEIAVMVAVARHKRLPLTSRMWRACKESVKSGAASSIRRRRELAHTHAAAAAPPERERERRPGRRPQVKTGSAGRRLRCGGTRVGTGASGPAYGKQGQQRDTGAHTTGRQHGGDIAPSNNDNCVEQSSNPHITVGDTDCEEREASLAMDSECWI